MSDRSISSVRVGTFCVDSCLSSDDAGQVGSLIGQFMLDLDIDFMSLSEIGLNPIGFSCRSVAASFSSLGFGSVWHGPSDPGRKSFKSRGIGFIYRSSGGTPRSTVKDPLGRCMRLSFLLNSDKCNERSSFLFHFVVVYGPSGGTVGSPDSIDDENAVRSWLGSCISPLTADREDVIVLGDLNSVAPDDVSLGVSGHVMRHSSICGLLINELPGIDVFRLCHPALPGYTYVHGEQKSRLDYFICWPVVSTCPTAVGVCLTAPSPSRHLPVIAGFVGVDRIALACKGAENSGFWQRFLKLIRLDLASLSPSLAGRIQSSFPMSDLECESWSTKLFSLTSSCV